MIDSSIHYCCLPPPPHQPLSPAVQLHEDVGVLPQDALYPPGEVVLGEEDLVGGRLLFANGGGCWLCFIYMCLIMSNYGELRSYSDGAAPPCEVVVPLQGEALHGGVEERRRVPELGGVEVQVRNACPGRVN